MKKNKNKRSLGSKEMDNILLLFSMDEFIEKVENIRKSIGIPKEMFSEETDDIDKEIYSQLLMGKIITKLDEGERPLNILADGIKEIINEFNLPEHYSSIIEHFIYFNKVKYPIPPFSFWLDKNKKSVNVKVHEKLTDKDLIKLKEITNDYFDKYLNEIRPLKNIEPKLVVEKYYKNRNVCDPESFKEYRLSAKEIAENVKADTGKKIKTKDIYDIPRKLESTRKIRFKKLGKK
ncbi:TPA: hypothetical protein DIC38_00435 [Candidatus Nomurabacteria bacterium]|nr:MAG: hypothetical protein O210_OD1C00001G0645 [Parcubacteria bacterium RAAC4_OD1_1]HCY26140.1 hypothetical protein [Candidatus Nomurabacteria bacterium]